MNLTPQEKQLVKAAYYMGFKSANQIQGHPLNDKVENTVDILIPISRGETTMQSTGAELRANNPNYPDDIESIVQENNKIERAIANAILGR